MTYLPRFALMAAMGAVFGFMVTDIARSDDHFCYKILSPCYVDDPLPGGVPGNWCHNGFIRTQVNDEREIWPSGSPRYPGNAMTQIEMQQYRWWYSEGKDPDEFSETPICGQGPWCDGLDDPEVAPTGDAYLKWIAWQSC